MLIRKKILITGVVQGVGFRPNVYKLALANGVCGWVKNDSAGVAIEAQGGRRAVNKFISELWRKKPPRARLDRLAVSSLRPRAAKAFAIIKSGGRAEHASIIPVDLALCGDCRRELNDPGDRRYLYPFINCTNCGPRFTIVKKLPYDRPFTTMSGFKMCPACRREYENPLDRRFHAQPNACPACGPGLKTAAGKKISAGAAALESAAAAIFSGEIAAVQSLGGFHLACRADLPAAVARLRRLKSRPHKPFAIMVDGIAAARALCAVSREEEALLGGHRAPVVMLAKKNTALLEAAAPGLSRAGVMLAYTPLHAALFKLLARRGFGGALVMTSGNRRDEPIASSIEEARVKLKGMSRALVFHNRAIHSRADDSVAFVSGGEARLLRRARGFVPEAVKLKKTFKTTVLGCGADLKNTFCLTRFGEAFLSQHIGDLGEKLNQDFYSETLVKMKRLLKVSPAVIAYDPHPAYASRALALSFKGKKIPVYHHAAHILSVAAERGLEAPFIGAAFDGTGYGPDGNIWGGEFLVFEGSSWRRAGHLGCFGLPGGEAAVREIWRGAFSLLSRAMGPTFKPHKCGMFKNVSSEHLATTARLLELGLNCPVTSSVGRLFDAVACLAGLGETISYEGQAAMELESLFKTPRSDFYQFPLSRENGQLILDPSKAVAGAYLDRGKARLVCERFHCGLADAACRALIAISSQTGIKTICLSGGVFQNRIMLELVSGGLSRAGLKVYSNSQVPSNDGGISLGQVWGALTGFSYSAGGAARGRSCIAQ